jgi:hypothetical protein
MKKYLITFLLCLSSIISFGQKKVVYLNDDLVEIPKSIFEKEFDYSKFYKINFDLENSTFSNLSTFNLFAVPPFLSKV